MFRDKYLSNSEIDPDQSKQSLGAGDVVAKCLFKWLVAVEGYDKVAKQVPRQVPEQKCDSYGHGHSHHSGYPHH